MKRSAKKKLLILVDWFWPGFKAGGPIKSTLNLVKWLKDDFDFYVITSDRDHLSEIPYENIEPNKWNNIPMGIPVYYANLSQFSRKDLQSLIEAVNPDIVLLNSMFSRPFTVWPLMLMKSQKIKGEVLLAPRGMLANGALSVKPVRKKVYLRMFKMMRYPKLIKWLATGEHEVEDIQNAFGEVSIFQSSNLPEPDLPELLPAPDKSITEFVCVARISPEKNQIMLAEFFSYVTQSVILRFVGPYENEVYFKKCKEAFSSLPKNIEVIFEGAIPPDQLFRSIKGAHFFILPTLGENFGHAIYESLALGKPVIISDQTPWSFANGSKAGWAIPLMEKEKFREVIKAAIMMDTEEYQLHSSAARSYIEGVHSEIKPLNELRKFLNGLS